MNRAFISLYFFIVASVVLIGWGLNQFWESIAPAQEPTAEIHALFTLIEHDVLTQQPQSDAGYTQAAQQLSKQLNLPLELLSLDDLAQSAAMHDLHAGKILAVSSNGDIVWYKRLAHTDHVIMLSVPISDESESPFYRLLLIVFYLAIALAIYLWVWPLSRDSKKLESQTRTLGKDGVPETLEISPTSTLYPLAQAFNHMAQRLRELIASHREMTNAVSHELRTPLARMKFALAMIEEEKLNDKDRRQLRSVEQDIAEMESLISALLAYAGFEQKTQQLKQTSGHMRDLLEELQLRFARNSPRQQPLALEICDSTNNAEFICEWKLIETVLQNFINNAARYAKARIRIELIQTQREYIIAIEDDGAGIPKDKRERVFESFVRLYHEDQDENTSGSATGGFGLGLAIVKRIMQWHQGSAQFVEPHILGGARAEIRWPKHPS
jgi:signal transduction histidine kinase